LQKIVQRMTRAPTEAARAKRLVRVMLFAMTDKGTGAKLASAGSADFVLAPIVTHQVVHRQIVDVEEWVTSTTKVLK